MASRTARIVALALLLAPGSALAGAVRADLAEAYDAWQPPAAQLVAGTQAAAIGIDLQVPRHLGCVRTRDPSTGVTVRCVTDPAHRSTHDLVDAQRATEGGVRPIVFMDLGSVVAMRLRDHLGERFEQVDVDRGPIPVTVRLKYDIHSGRFGERDMRVELVADLEGQTIEVVGHSRDRLSPAHMAWFVPTVPLAGLGLILLERLDREAVATQAVATIDDATAQLAAALAEHQLEHGLRPPSTAPPSPEPAPRPRPPEEPPAAVQPAPEPPVAQPAPEPPVAQPAPEPPVAQTDPAPPAGPRVKLPKRPSRCQDTTAARLSSLAGEAVVAFATHDRQAFEDAADAAARALPCVDEVVHPPQAAEFHRLVALRAWYAGDRQAAELAFRASLALEPDFSLPRSLAPQDGGLRMAWDRAREAHRSRSMAVEAPAGARVWIDGRVASERPMDLPSLVQLGTPPDHVGWTGYLGPGGAVPGQRGGSSLSMVPFSFIRSAEVASDEARWGLPERAVAERDPEPAPQPEPLPEPEPAPDFPPNPLVAEPVPEPVHEPPPPRVEPERRRRDDLAQLPPPARQRDAGMRSLALVTGGAALALYGTAHATRWRFDHDGPTKALMWTTNGCYLGSIGLGLTSAAFTTLWLTGGQE
jgi:hypothetical protein